MAAIQSERSNYRFRGWRESRVLVELAAGLPTDLTKTMTNLLTAEASYQTNLQPQLDTLTVTQVSTLQHLRSQIRWRLTSSN